MSSPKRIERKKRIRVDSERARGIVRPLVLAQGFAVVEENEPADLSIIEVAHPQDLGVLGDGPPAIALSRRRLREGELCVWKAAGARAVIDADSSVLDLAFAISEIAFGTRCAMRRYGRTFGGTPVRFRASTTVGVAAGMNAELGVALEHGGVGRLLGIARSGAFIATEQRIPEGTPIEVEMDLSGRSVSLRGRVAFVEEHEIHEGIAIEFALDDGE